MSEKMTEDEFIEHSKKGLNVPIWHKFAAHDLDPIAIFKTLQKTHERAFLLDSANLGHASNRFSYIGFDPYIHVETKGNRICLVKEGETTTFDGDPFKTVRDLVKDNKAVDIIEQPTLVGGAVGYFSYDFIRLVENIPDRHTSNDDFPDIMFNFYKTIISFNHEEHTICIYTCVNPLGDLKQLYRSTIDEINVLHAEIKIPYSVAPKTFPAHDVEVSPSDEDFKEMILKAKHYIHEGDIFQVVLSRTFKVKTQADPFDVYCSLRKLNPSPYLFYIEEPGYQVAGSSPERLVTINNGIVKTNPLAGTSKRGGPEKDEQIEKELLNDDKETAEHRMLVDLGRNDIGSISEIGTVKVTKLMSILRLEQLVHISSEVEGKLRSGLDGLDAISAVLPAGTLSGAPKIRAMQIIDELEMSRRGIYGGAICYQCNTGTFDSCIAIRMIIFKDGIATVRAGAGIVYDSTPEKEVDETRLKAQACLDAIRLAERGME